MKLERSTWNRGDNALTPLASRLPAMEASHGNEPGAG
jgi:hypothetical protein